MEQLDDYLLSEPPDTPAVLKAADDPDEQVRLAAIKALGRVIGLKEIEVLTERLREAIQRYTDSPRAVETEYLLADCCRLTAKRLEEKLRQDRVENIRLARSKQTRELLDAALVRYRTIQEKLARRQETDELSDLQKNRP